jgi:DNA-binding Lrp family transcriptional regulator
MHFPLLFLFLIWYNKSSKIYKEQYFRRSERPMDRLLTLLHENARLSNKQLAAMLDETEENISAAIADYEKQGVIRGYQALINWERVDTNKAIALIELRVSPKKNRGFDEIAGKVMSFPEVDSVYLMSGGYDLAVTVHGKSMQDVAMFVMRRLSTLDSVLSTATHFILTRYKESGVIMNQEEEKDERRDVYCD